MDLSVLLENSRIQGILNSYVLQIAHIVRIMAIT